MAAVERQPFGELSSGRLQQLASAKNRQNGLIVSMEAGKPSVCTPTPTKRSYAMSSLNDDSENVDPTHSLPGSKKNKFELCSTPVKAMASMLPPKHQFTAPQTRPIGRTLELSPSRAPMSAPAGRSPKRKTIGLAKPRRSFMPYTRIDPPFSTKSAGLPFSLDAALSGTLGSTAAKAYTPLKPMPASWKFEIHEDSLEEESATLMEHSTLTLDLSSDDESTTEKKTDRGKENTPPEGYEAPLALSSSQEGAQTLIKSKKVDIIRKKIETDDMDDGQRSPLSSLEVEPFSTVKCGEESFVVIEPDLIEAPKHTVQLSTSTQMVAQLAAPTEQAVSLPASPKQAVQLPATTEQAPQLPATTEQAPSTECSIEVFEDEVVTTA